MEDRSNWSCWLTRYAGRENGTEGEKSIDAEISFSISSEEWKSIDRWSLLVLVVAAVVAGPVGGISAVVAVAVFGIVQYLSTVLLARLFMFGSKGSFWG